MQFGILKTKQISKTPTQSVACRRLLTSRKFFYSKKTWTSSHLFPFPFLSFSKQIPAYAENNSVWSIEKIRKKKKLVLILSKTKWQWYYNCKENILFINLKNYLLEIFLPEGDSFSVWLCFLTMYPSQLIVHIQSWPGKLGENYFYSQFYKIYWPKEFVSIIKVIFSLFHCNHYQFGLNIKQVTNNNIQ